MVYRFLVIISSSDYDFFAEITSRTYRKSSRKNAGIFETAEEGITNAGMMVLEKLLMDLKKYDVLEGLDATDKVEQQKSK